MTVDKFFHIVPVAGAIFEMYQGGSESEVLKILRILTPFEIDKTLEKGGSLVLARDIIVQSFMLNIFEFMNLMEISSPIKFLIFK